MNDSLTLHLTQEELQVHTGTRTSKWAREAIRKKLVGLAGGRLQVKDAWGEWTAGQAGPIYDLTVHDSKFYWDVALGGSVGAGGAYIDGSWSCNRLPEVLRLFVRNTDLTDALEGGMARAVGALNWLRHRLNRNSKGGSARNIHAHYDLGNDFFALILDPSMTYSCGIFEPDPTDLAAASFEKLDRVCRKLQLGPQHHVLEIGTGWGSFSMHAARHYGCRVTTTTISKEQAALARERIDAAGLSRQIEVVESDYRDLSGQYDRLVSIEMIEAVGHEFLPTFFSKSGALLKPDGAMMLQAINMPDDRYDQYLRSSDFIRAYVFPGSCCPALSAMQSAIGGSSDLKTVHLEDIGPHYATTLAAWRQNLLRNQNKVQALGYPKHLLRLWDFYLSYCQAGFEERYIGTLQMLLHKPGCRDRLVDSVRKGR